MIVYNNTSLLYTIFDRISTQNSQKRKLETNSTCKFRQNIQKIPSALLREGIIFLLGGFQGIALRLQLGLRKQCARLRQP